MVADKNTLSTRVTGVLLTLLAAFVFAAGHVLSRSIVVGEIHPVIVVAARFFFAGIFLLLAVSGFSLIRVLSRFLFAGGSLKHHAPKHSHSKSSSYLNNSSDSNSRLPLSRDGVLMIASRSLAGLCYMMAFGFISATSTVMLYNLNPFFTLVLTLLLVRRSFTLWEVACITLGVFLGIGGSLYSFQGEHELANATELNAGVLLMLVAGFCWAIYTIFSERDPSSRISTSSLSQRLHYLGILQLWCGLPFLVAIFGDIAWGSTIRFEQLHVRDYASLASLGALSAIVLGLYFEAVKRAPSLLVSVLVSIEIFFTMLLEWYYLALPLSTEGFLGAILVIVGAMLVMTYSNKLKF